MHVTNFKKPKGSYLIERREKRKKAKAFEEGEKRKVRTRDVRCRWPSCEYCREFKPRLEVAHLNDKGMGGDHGLRSTADQMLLLCFLIHQGPRSLHSGDRRIEPLTERGTDGPCLFLELKEAGWCVVFCEDGK